MNKKNICEAVEPLEKTRKSSSNLLGGASLTEQKKVILCSVLLAHSVNRYDIYGFSQIRKKKREREKPLFFISQVWKNRPNWTSPSCLHHIPFLYLHRLLFKFFFALKSNVLLRKKSFTLDAFFKQSSKKNLTQAAVDMKKKNFICFLPPPLSLSTVEDYFFYVAIKRVFLLCPTSQKFI